RVRPYPALPVLYIAALVTLGANTLWTRPTESFSGLLIVAAGVPVFLLWRRRARAAGLARGGGDLGAPPGSEAALFHNPIVVHSGPRSPQPPTGSSGDGGTAGKESGQ